MDKPFTLFVPKSLSPEQRREIRALNGTEKRFVVKSSPIAQRCWAEGLGTDVFSIVVLANSLLQRWTLESYQDSQA